MDKETLDRYEKDGETFIQRYTDALPPERVYDLVKTFFHKSGRTIDIGCASGRDLKYLREQEYAVEGLDAVEKFVTHCQQVCPECEIHQDSLPQLKTLADESYDNILLSAVLMHWSPSDLIESAVNILRVAKTNARLVISIRGTRGENERESDGRLFTPISSGRLIALFEGLGAKLLFQETQQEENRPEVQWQNYIFEKIDPSKKSGIDSIQEIIIKDKKDTSYKLALLRALVEMARLENGMATYDDYRDYVYIPLKRVAFYWLKFYFPLLKGTPLLQSKSHSNLAFQEGIQELNYGINELGRLVDDYEAGKNTESVEKLLKAITKTIKAGPMKYISDSDNPVFPYLPKSRAKAFIQLQEIDYGLIGIPTQIWHDLMLFGHWIEDSLLIQWARFTEKTNRTEDFAEYLKLLSTPLHDERTTQEIRALYQGQEIECVWTGKKTKVFDVDHVIPYSVWFNNDLWNMLPTDSQINKKKKDCIPHPQLVRKREEALVYYWREYQRAFPKKFSYQLNKALGITKDRDWEKEAFLSFYQVVSRLDVHRVVGTWAPAQKTPSFM